MDETKLFFNEISLLTKLSPYLKFSNYRINPLLLGDIDTTLEYTYSKFQVSSWHLN